MITSDNNKPHFPEMNYCQNRNHYIQDEKTKRLLHKSDTTEMRECLFEQFKIQKIGPFSEKK
jgi:hypothetical protein